MKNVLTLHVDFCIGFSRTKKASFFYARIGDAFNIDFDTCTQII